MHRCPTGMIPARLQPVVPLSLFSTSSFRSSVSAQRSTLASNLTPIISKSQEGNLVNLLPQSAKCLVLSLTGWVELSGRLFAHLKVAIVPKISRPFPAATTWSALSQAICGLTSGLLWLVASPSRSVLTLSTVSLSSIPPLLLHSCQSMMIATADWCRYVV